MIQNDSVKSRLGNKVVGKIKTMLPYTYVRNWCLATQVQAKLLIQSLSRQDQSSSPQQLKEATGRRQWCNIIVEVHRYMTAKLTVLQVQLKKRILRRFRPVRAGGSCRRRRRRSRSSLTIPAGANLLKEIPHTILHPDDRKERRYNASS